MAAFAPGMKLDGEAFVAIGRFLFGEERRLSARPGDVEYYLPPGRWFRFWCCWCDEQFESL